MATTTQVVLREPAVQAFALRRTNPLVAWHLLSLDAPTVAVLWTWFAARAGAVHLPAICLCAMALAVWILYAADRLLDARILTAPLDLTARPGAPLEQRHLFHHRWRTQFLAAIAVAALALAALIPRLDPAAIRLFVIEGALLAAWFLVRHASTLSTRLPKELVVGVFFASAVFIPTLARRAGLRLPLLPAVLLFAALCTLNCLFIETWEHVPGASPSHRFAAIPVRALALAEIAAGAPSAALSHGSLRPIGLACALSATLLLVLDRRRTRLSRTLVRAAADLALLTPLALLHLLR